MYGSDQAASIGVGSLRSFVDSIRAIPKVIGSGKKVITEKEKAVRKKLRVNID